MWNFEISIVKFEPNTYKNSESKIYIFKFKPSTYKDIAFNLKQSKHDRFHDVERLLFIIYTIIYLSKIS